MKTRKAFALTLIAFCSFIMIAPATGQEETKELTKKEARRQKKEEKKANRKAFAEQENIKAKTALVANQFVLEANRVYDRHGRGVNVSDQTNFVALEGDEAVLQLAFTGYGGPNGIGGITLTGRPTRIKVEEDKRGNTTFTMNVLGSVMNAEIRIVLSASGNNAEAWVSSATMRHKLRFSGYLVPRNESSYYKSGFGY